MAGKLSSTEIKAYELYRSGLKPREISQKLGISVNTVYKAISKARKVLDGGREREEVQNHTGSYGITVILTVSAPSDGALSNKPEASSCEVPVDVVGMLRRIESVYMDLLREVREVKKLISTEPAATKREFAQEVIEGVPDFIRDNLWVDVIRSRRISGAKP